MASYPGLTWAKALNARGQPVEDTVTDSIEAANIAYWNELCGTRLATSLGVTDASPESLRKFDTWFFDFYPYLLQHVTLADLAGRNVLEIGLGYGSLSQKLAEGGARFTGLDIAPGPVEMVRHRLRQAHLPGDAKQGSILAAPFPDQSFDAVISIGCLHHIGDMKRGIDECWRLLRPGGTLVVMVYYAYSYRRWMQARRQTLYYLSREVAGYRGVVTPSRGEEKWDYDHDNAGRTAPHIDFISVKSLRSYCSRFSNFRCRLQNIDQEPPFQKRTRQQLLTTAWPRILGLDIYASAIKQ
jgi:2-polyprenyl-3-methyl-5-hydroxy-6-metoxy-1,4-benzoquinol methylase